MFNKGLIRDCYTKSIHLIPTRKKIAKSLISKNAEVYERQYVGAEERSQIKKIWGSVSFDLNWLRFFNSIEREETKPFDARYIPMDIAYGFVYPYFNFQQGSSFMDDKNYYDMYFHDVHMPKTVCRVMKGMFMDAAYHLITKEQAVQLCDEAGRVIVKPSALTSGGGGITFRKPNGGGLSVDNEVVIQELINQHEDLSLLHKDSVNTLRLLTYHDCKEPVLLSAVVRMGANGSEVDNASKGGLFCGIKENGQLTKYGYNRQGQAFDRHPQGAVFKECRIPNYDKCKKLVLELSNRLIKVARLIAWDIAVADDGEPVLIEVNLAYSGVDLFQIANGPLFGDRTEEVIAEVFSDKLTRIANKIFI